MALEDIVKKVMGITPEQEDEKRKQEQVKDKEKKDKEKVSVGPDDKQYEERMHEQEQKEEQYRMEASKMATVTGNQQVVAMAENLKSQNVESPYLTAYIQRAQNAYNTGTEKVLDRETGHTMDKVEADKTLSVTDEAAEEDVTQSLYQRQQLEEEEEENFEI